MPYSSGTFSRVHDFTDDRDNGIRIQASRMDAEMDGIATGLSTALLKDGTQTATAKIPFAVGLSVIDNQTILLGTNSDIAIQYDETTNDSLEISANVEGAAFNLVLKSDQGDDNADQHKLSIADGGTLTLGSKISGSFVSYLTHTPNSTVASSTLAVAGNLTVGGNLTLGSGAELSEAELEMLDGITAGTVAASKAVVVDANKDIASFRNITLTGELDAATGDFSGDVDVDGTLEADAITVNGTALATVIAGTTVTTATNANHVSVADNESTNEENLIPFIEDASATGNVGLESDGDFAYNPSTGTVSATVFKGNIDAVDGDFDGTLEADAMTLNGTAITATATLDTGISNNNVPKFTSGVADDDFLRVNGTAIEGRSASEVLSDIGGQAALTFGISDTNIPIFTSGVADDDFLRVNGTSIEGRSASEVFSDIGASPAEGSSNIVTTGALNAGSITSGFGTIDTGSSTITTTGAITGGSLVVDDITIDGSTISDSGDLTVDVAGDITLDAGGGDINIADDGTTIGVIANDGSSNFVYKSSVSDKDIIFKGNDGGSVITALTLDMSDAGTAIFNHDIKIADNNNIQLGAGVDLMLSSDGTNGKIANLQSNGDIIFEGNDGGSTIEAARFDMSGGGHFLVGTTSADSANVGARMKSGGRVDATVDGGTCMILNRLTNDGYIIVFNQAGTEQGKILSKSDTICIGSGDSLLRFNYGSGSAIVPVNLAGDLNDNQLDLGEGSARFDDIFATNGTIQTSDRNEKQDIEELTDAEKRVAVVAKGLMRKFRWKDKVAQKGDNARTHFGIIAQDLQDAFTAESLDASKYAMFCSNTWWEKEISVDAVEAIKEVKDEEGYVTTEAVEAKDAYTYIDSKQEATEGYTEKTRLGVRYSELLAFIIAAI